MIRRGIIIEGTDLKKSIVKDSSGKILRGFEINESDAQNIQFNLEMMPGDLKEFPTIGCGIYEYMNGIIDQAFYRKAAISLKADLYNIRDVEITTE